MLFDIRRVFGTYGTWVGQRLKVRRGALAMRTQKICMGWGGISAGAAYALFSYICYIHGFGDLLDLVVPIRRGAR